MQCAASGKWPQCSAGVIAAVVTIVGTGSDLAKSNDSPLAMLELRQKLLASVSVTLANCRALAKEWHWASTAGLGAAECAP